MKLKNGNFFFRPDIILTRSHGKPVPDPERLRSSASFPTSDQI